MRNGKILSAFGALTVVAGIATTAQGTIVFRDDFEGFDVAEAAFPQAGLGLNPIASVGTWVIAESEAENVQVTRDFAPVQGVQALGLGRYGTGGQFTAATFAASPTEASDPLKISFKFRDPLPSWAFGTSDRVNLIARNASDANYTNQVFNITLNTGWNGTDVLTATFGATGLAVDSTSRADFSGIDFENDWIDIEILVNFDSKTYTLSVNGASHPHSTNVAFNGDAATASAIQQFIFYNEYSTDTVFAIDDVTVEVVPEPASLAVLAMGGMAALRRSRRHIV